MITRTDNGLQDIWLMKKNISDNFEVPGILEVEAAEQLAHSLGSTPVGALEPKKVVIQKPKNSMHPFHERDMELLKKMRSRVNYLRNPRFPYQVPNECIGILRDDVIQIEGGEHKLSPEELASKALRSIGGGIVALPSSIHFADYQPNQTYSKTLIIKNRSPYSARFRLSIPPPFEYSPFFSVTMISTPSDGDGLVAPGMGCQYRVDFTPNTLANFQQVLVVYTELGTNLPGISFEPFSVQLSGTRAAPELTMPDVLHCGPCRDGFVAIRKWKFKNVGGSGRFMILGANDETDVAQIFADIGSYNTEAEYQAAIADKTNESSRARTFSQDAFEIFPSYFSLLTGEYEEITVKFFPEPMEQDDTSTKKVETILRIACDNCQVLELPVRANVQKPSVSITACNPVHMQALDEQAWDVEGVKFQFGNQNLQATTSLQLTLKNQSRLKLPFIWVPVDNPGFHSEAKRNYTVSTISGNGTVSDSLKFTPASGAFTPNGEITFQVSFTPTRQRSMTSLEGTGLEYNVQVKPELILVPSPIHAGHSKNTEIRIVNNSIAPVSYEWSIEGIDPEVANIAISVPEASKVDPNEDLKFLVSIIGVFPAEGTIDGSLICKTAGQTGPLIKVPIRGTVDLKPGDLDFSVPIVDFGLLALGTSANATVPLINKSTLPLYYKLVAHSTQPEGANEKMPQGKGILADPWHLNISSSEGMLDPGEKIDIHFTFIPIWYQSFRGRLSCAIAQSSESSKAILVTGLDMCAEVQTPYAIIQHSENAVACYVNEPFMWKVTIENKRMLQTKFVWKQPQDETEVKVHFEPSSADLGPGEKIDVNITLTYSEIGLDQFSEFHCAVEGMIENGGIMKAKIKTDVLGLSINLKFPKDDEKILNFGNECPIFESRTRSFVIENLSAIASSYRLWVETFTAVGVDKLELENEKTSVKKRLDAGNYILKPTEKPKLGFSSETGKKWLDNVTEVRKTIQRMNQVLQEGRGAAFHPSPSFGTLPPFGRVKITITSYNNLVGLYNDKLVCEVGPWLRETIPITLGVDGIPVKFSGAQLVLSKSHSKIERINFGTQIAQHGIRMPLPPFGSEFYNNGRKSVFARFMSHGHGTSEIDGTAMSNVNAEPATINKKEFQVENQSPRTICLRWNVFVKRQSLTSVVAQKNAGTTPSTSEVDQLLLDELVNNDPMTSAVVVQPSPMFIPAFKTLPARISFCAKDTGFYKALLVADVGYVQPDGSISFSPMGASDDDSFYDNSSFERNLLAPLKKLEAENEHFPEGLTLPRIRKVRLLVQGKAIEPKLVFDDVIAKEDGVEQKESAVWFKKVRDEEILELDRQRKQKLQELEVQRIQYEKDVSEKTKNAILAQHKNSASVFIISDTRNPALNDKYFQIVHEEFHQKKSLQHNSQEYHRNTCSFSINVSPCEAFKVAKVEKPQTPTPRAQKPVSSNTNRAVTSIKTPAEGLGRASQSQSQSRRTSRTSRVSKDTEHKLPFTAPTTAALSAASPSKESVISLRNSSSKKSKTPALGDEVDDIPAGTVYELNPGETVRIDIECLDREILKTTTVEDNVSTNPSYIQSRASRPTDDFWTRVHQTMPQNPPFSYSMSPSPEDRMKNMQKDT
ncbi:hypothetical protein BCR33DRAFT_741401 [Rhizoclosmatium globosum]|uniref:MSP domain-containing protein n=1 Tax=Rhizoclosmatium globosum TaxID=329046 RepID=A0A1Y2BUU4_9FUNG|nr:hypothetical protein BCR33DRAFT_741401 [Rhizoclosmatium globosum]|eukprot:ORY38516.1 hypothetical protein BCR33DRAFT_741401 [Rhizoclosmatium globosum]